MANETKTAPLDLAPIKARVAAATPGPWTENIQGAAVVTQDPAAVDAELSATPYGRDTVAYYGGALIGESIDASNRTFIAHARHDLPALVAEVERLRSIFLAVANNFENCGHEDACLLARQYRAVARGEA